MKKIKRLAAVLLAGIAIPFSREGVGNELPQSKPDGFASSLWEGASGVAGKFAAVLKAPPFGGAGTPKGVTERVHAKKAPEGGCTATLRGKDVIKFQARYIRAGRFL